MTGRKHIKSGLYLSYFYLLLNFTINLVLTPLILRYLGQSVYGLWAIFSSSIGYFMIFDLGMNVSVAKYTSEYLALGNLKGLSKLVSSIVMAFIFLSFFGVALCFTLLPLLPKIFNIPQNLRLAGQLTFMILAINVALSFFKGVYLNIFYGCQRVDVYKIFSAIHLLITSILIGAFLKLGYNIIGLAMAAALGSAVTFIGVLLYFRHCRFGIAISFKSASFQELKKIASYSIRNFALQLTSVILYKTDIIVIGIFLNSTQAAPYDIAYKLVFYATYLFSEISSVLFPKFSKLYALDSITSLKNLALSITKISVAIAVPVIISFSFFGRHFINLWVGAENFVGQNVFGIFIIMYLMHGLGAPPFLLLQAIGKNRGTTISEIIRAFLNIVLSIILVQKMGVFGVALGTLLANLLTSFWFIPWSACKKIQLSVKTYILAGVLPPLLIGIPISAITWFFIKDILPNSNFLFLVTKGVLVALIYFPFYFIFCTPAERQLYVSMLPLKWPNKNIVFPDTNEGMTKNI